MSSISNTMDFTVEMLNKLADLAGQIETLQALVRANHSGEIPTKKTKKAKKEKDPDAPPKELSPGVKAWQEFNSKVDALLKENSLSLQAGEGKQFTSSLKKLKGYEWANEDILEQRRAWVKPEKTQKAETASVASVAEVVEVAEIAPSAPEPAAATPKKAGRPKKDKATKAIGAAPGAPKKGAKEAWAEDDVIKELDAHLAE